ncbi:T9SS type A sorting domain-containing protein [Flavobacterium tegetincola]|uniref:T9SS type A sorting domain-containing protein n=1 Tax=Flavobacterium tegetincola TaxID=150172 RepID=UPI00040110FB|nr:T9SS type A sorting domain-containing protein [Flavobacterium tegetincola]
MKIKLLSLFFVLLLSNTIYSQTNTTDYASGLTDATYLKMNGTDMYVLGSQNIYKIDTAASNPTPTVIYTVPSGFSLVHFTINANLLYVALENYIAATETFLGGKIIAVDVNNLSNPAQDIYTTSEYISSVTNVGATLYITAETLLNPPSFEPFMTHLDVIDASVASPTAQTLVTNVTNTSVIGGSVYDNAIVYLSSQDDDEILSINVSQAVPTVTTFQTFSFSRGLFKLNNELYMSNGSLIKKIDVTNPSAGSNSVAVNAAYQDTNPNDGSLFFANFRDVVVVGNTIYATLKNQGKVVQAVDTTLDTKDFNNQLSEISLYNNQNQVSVNGLTDESYNVRIYSLTGAEMIEQNISPDENSIDISQLSNGMYLLTIDDQQTYKFAK